MLRALALIAALVLPGCAAYDNADIIQPAGSAVLERISATSLVHMDELIAAAKQVGNADLETCLVKLRGYVSLVHGGTTGMSSPVTTAMLLYIMRHDAKAALDQCGEVLSAI